jgi:MFS family permease
LIADYHTGATRSRAIGIHQMGIYCGVIAGGFSGFIADAPSLGWRWGFDVCGVGGMLFAIPLLVFLRDAPKSFDPTVVLEKPSPLRAARALLTNPSFILLVLYFTLPAMAAWIVRDWMPATLKTEFNISQGKAGVLAAVPWQLAAIVGALGGGWLADRWTEKTARGRIFASALGVAMIIPAMFGIALSPQTGLLWVAVVFLVLFGLGWGFFDANNMPILCQITRPEVRATGYGIMNLVSISWGGLADWGFGILRHRQVPLGKIFSILASAAVISIVLVLLIKPRAAESDHS